MRTISASKAASDTAGQLATIPLEVTDVDYIWLFLLFFAVLAAAWFYLQRAKARPTTTVTTTTEAPTPADVHTESTDQRPAS